jgi:hypothetical protein
MAAEAVALTMIVSMIVAMAVTFVRVAVGFLGFLVHRLDSNRDSVCLIAWIRGGSVIANGADRGERRERTRRPKRN